MTAAVLETLPIAPGRAGRVWRYRAPGRTGRPHRHAELELDLVLAGGARYDVDGVPVDLGPGDGLLLWPRHVHVLQEQSRDFAMWIVVVRPDLLDRVCTSVATAALRDPVGPSRPVHWATDPARMGWIDALLGTLTAPVDDALHAAALSHALLAACSTVHREQDPAAGGCAHDARRLLDDGGWDWTVPRLARAVGTSPSTLARAFKQAYGRTLVEYRHEAQVARVRAIYGSGARTTLTEAAAMAGFGSYSQFARVFTRLSGCSPREYARRVAQDGA